MSVTPLLTTQILAVDQARLEYINSIQDHIAKLREEIRINEITLHWVIKSVSNKSEAMLELDAQLQQAREDEAKLPRARQLLTREQLDDFQHKLLADSNHDK